MRKRQKTLFPKDEDLLEDYEEEQTSPKPKKGSQTSPPKNTKNSGSSNSPTKKSPNNNNNNNNSNTSSKGKSGKKGKSKKKQSPNKPSNLTLTIGHNNNNNNNNNNTTSSSSSSSHPAKRWSPRDIIPPGATVLTYSEMIREALGHYGNQLFPFIDY